MNLIVVWINMTLYSSENEQTQYTVNVDESHCMDQCNIAQQEE